MTKRWGNLGVGALLSLSMATGCVTTGPSWPDDARSDNATAQQTQPARPATKPLPLNIPKVTDNSLAEGLAHIDPPPEPDVIPIPTVQPSSVVAQVSSRVALAPTEVKELPILIALRGAVEKHPAEVFQALQKYDKHTQEVLLAMLPLAARLSEGGLDKASPQERTALVEQLNEAITVLRGNPPLSIEKVCYCRRITNFGLYDSLPDDHAFLAGVSKKHGELVELYVEARNFQNRQNVKFYEVSLAGRLELRRDAPGGEVVWRHEFPASPDHSLSPRQDYFINYWFWVPPMLEPGDYKLTICLRDDNAPGEETKRTMPFHVSSGASPH